MSNHSPRRSPDYYNPRIALLPMPYVCIIGGISCAIFGAFLAASSFAVATVIVTKALLNTD